MNAGVFYLTLCEDDEEHKSKGECYLPKY